ncbi:MAG: ribonuclease P protein component [Cyanobacteriota bacterium]|nr:ribonuclease P protein component [Cyanobacteriota bacterium]
MLPKRHRLCTTQEFTRVYQGGRKAVSPHLAVRVLSFQAFSGPGYHSPVPPACRVGFVVSQKVNKRAVIRNRIKRRLRAAMATLIEDLPSPLWIVVNVRPGADRCNYDDFLRELRQLLIQLEVIHGHP